MDIYFAKVKQWILETKRLAPEVCDWIGVYYKESYLYQIDSTDLVIGPYVGEVTEHTRISIDRGFCGMALREERTVNVADVTKDDTHIACSLKTRSELVIPISDRNGKFIAELDIDCNRLNAFTKELQTLFEKAVKNFPLLEDYLPLQWKEITTDRLLLRKVQRSDAQDIFLYAKNPNVARWVTWNAHESLKDTEMFLDHVESSYAKGALEPIGVCFKNDPDKKLIGTVGLMAVSPHNRHFELAYVIDEKYWGQGIVVEASRAIIDYAFKHFAVERIQARCKPENPQSSRVMEKLGMKYEGIARSVMFMKNQTWDLKVYSILKSEWR